MDIQENLRVEPLLLHVERSQLRWFVHLVRMTPGHIPGEVFWACPTGRRPWGQAQDTLEGLYFSAGLGMPQHRIKELMEVAGKREVWAEVATPATRTLDKQTMMDGWFTTYSINMP